MATTQKDYQIIQKVGEDEFILLHPETNADNVVVDIDGVEGGDLATVLKALKDDVDSKASSSEIPDVSQFITKAVEDLLNYYTKATIDDKITDLENKVSAIPKFSISVVAALPTEDISETTIYLVSTGNDSNNLYTEYIHVDGSWEILGTQKLDLTGYATETWVNAQISGFVTEARVQELIAAASIKAAETADKLSTARKISISGDVVGETTFDGSKDSVIPVVLSNTGVTAGVYTAVAVDEKGRVTAGSKAIEVGTAGQTTPSQDLAVGGLFLKLL